jgi:hypothetical protein
MKLWTAESQVVNITWISERDEEAISRQALNRRRVAGGMPGTLASSHGLSRPIAGIALAADGGAFGQQHWSR